MKDKNISHKMRAFTLVELLVAMSISSALLLFLAALVTRTTEGYSLSHKSIHQVAQARSFFQFFESEISSRLPETSIIHRASSQYGSENSDQIAFVRTLPSFEQSRENGGDLSTACYYVAYADEANVRVIPKLFRKTLNPEETQTLLESGESADFPEVDPQYDEPIVDGVLSYRATPMYFDYITGEHKPWDKSSQVSPTHIELSLSTIDESYFARFTTIGEWERLASSPKKSELQMIRTYTCRISIGK